MNSENNRNRNTTALAYDGIKEMISQYQLIPGQKITYDSLARKLKISSTPIINAFHRLAQEEFVTSIPNRGFFIKEISIEEVKEAFRVREVLEMLAIEDAIKNQTPAGLLDLEKARFAHQDIEHFTRKRLAMDAAFHLKIAQMGGNKYLARLLKHLFEHIYLRHRTEGLPHHRIAESVKEHRNIFMAIKGKNIAKAKRFIKRHIRESRKATTDGIQEAAISYRF